MSQADARLRELFAADDPAPRDPVFSAAVMETVERRRFVVDLSVWGGACAVGGLAMWALWPVVQPILMQASQQLAPAVAVLGVAAAAVFTLGRKASAVIGLEER